jgi:hypothetical protein
VTANLDGAADDGEAGENDSIASDVEDLIGGTGNDALTGDLAANTLTGNSGDDVLNGGEGVDVLLGSAGVDSIVSRDSAADQVSCGSEADSVIADVMDAVGVDCEAVDRGSNSGGGGGSAGTGGSGGGNPGEGEEGGQSRHGEVMITSRMVTMTARGVIAVRLACQGSGPCGGKVRVETVKKARFGSGRRRRALLLGRSRLHLAPGNGVTVRVQVTRRRRITLVRKKLFQLRVIVVTETGKVLERTVRLRLAKNAG